MCLRRHSSRKKGRLCSQPYTRNDLKDLQHSNYRPTESFRHLKNKHRGSGHSRHLPLHRGRQRSRAIWNRLRPLSAKHHMMMLLMIHQLTGSDWMTRHRRQIGSYLLMIPALSIQGQRDSRARLLNQFQAQASRT